MTGKSLRRIGGKVLDPFAQHIRMDFKIPSRLRNADTALLDQPDCLELELTGKLPP